METSSVAHAAVQKGRAQAGHDAEPKSANRAAVSDQQKTAATGFGEAVVIQLSDAIEDAAQGSSPGKSAQSPAHQARALLAERAAAAESGGGEKVSFGQIVSRYAQGLNPADAFTAPIEGAEEGIAPADEDAAEAAEGGAVVGAPAEGTSETGSDGLAADLIEEVAENDEDTA